MEAQPMTPVEALAQMRQIVEDSDWEYRHVRADKVLCALLLFLNDYQNDDSREDVREVVHLFENMEKWYA